MSDKVKKALKFTLSVLLAGALVYFAFRGVDWRSFADGLTRTRWGYIALFAVSAVLAIVFRALRWRDMLREIDPDALLLHTYDALNIGNVVNVVLPGAGEFVRCGYVSNKNARYEKALGTIVMERAWDVIAIIVLILTALLVNWSCFGNFIRDQILVPISGRFDVSAGLVLAAFAGTVALLVLLVRRHRASSRFLTKIHDFFVGIWRGFADAARMKHKARFVLYTVLVWTAYVMMSFFVLKAVPELSGLGFADALFISALGNFAALIPVPGGVGAYHYLVSLAFTGLYAIPATTGLLFATLSHEIHAVIMLLMGLASYIAILLRKKTKK